MIDVTKINPPADPTGVGDSTENIFWALNWPSPTGEAVYFPTGTYQITSASAASYPLLVQSDAEILGDGASSLVLIGSNTAAAAPFNAFSTPSSIASFGINVAPTNQPIATYVTAVASDSSTPAKIKITANINLSTNHYVSGQAIFISGCSAASGANGYWTISSISTDTCVLNNSVYVGSTTEGSSSTLEPAMIINAAVPTTLKVGQVVPITISNTTAQSGTWRALIMATGATTGQMSLLGASPTGTYPSTLATFQINPTTNISIHDIAINGGGQVGAGGVFSGVPQCGGINVTNASGVRIDNVVISDMGIMNPGANVQNIGGADNEYIDELTGGGGISIGATGGPVSNVRISRCTISNMAGQGINTGDGIYIGGTTSTTTVRDVVISDCRVSTCGRHCYTVSGKGADLVPEDIRIISCYGEKSALSGVDLEDGNDIVIDSCVFYQCGNDQTYYNPTLTAYGPPQHPGDTASASAPQYGLANSLMNGVGTGGGTNVVISNTHFDGCFYGVVLGPTAGLVISNCKFENSVLSDCWGSGYTDFRLTDCTFVTQNTNPPALTLAAMTGVPTLVSISTAANTIPTLSVTSVTNTHPITISTTTNHNMYSGQEVAISAVTSGSVTDTQANGLWAITSLGSTLFSLNGTDGSFQTASFTTGIATPLAVNIINAIVSSPTSVTVSTASTHGLTAGQTVVIAGLTGASMANGVWPILSIPTGSSTTFVIGSASGLQTGTYSFGTVQAPMVVSTSTSHNLSTGQVCNIASAIGNGINGTWVISSLTSASFSLNGSVHNTVTPGKGTVSGPITVSTNAAHGWPTGQMVSVSGVVGNTNANGLWPIISTGTSVFTLQGPVGNGTATLTAATAMPGPALLVTGASQTASISTTFASVGPSVNVSTATSFAPLLVASATSTGPVTLITSLSHGMLTGQTAIVAGIQGFAAGGAPNGTWFVNSLGSTTLALTNSTVPASGSYVTGGTIWPSIIVSTSTAHGLLTGMTATVAGVTGNVNANGLWTVTSLSGTTLSLNGSAAGSAAYAAGGTVTGPVTISTVTAHGLSTGQMVNTAIGPVDAPNPNYPVLSIGADVFALIGVSLSAQTSIATPLVVPDIVITTPTHGYTTGQVVNLSGIGGLTASNGLFSITSIDSAHFALNTSPAYTTNTYSTGGVALSQCLLGYGYSAANSGFRATNCVFSRPVAIYGMYDGAFLNSTFGQGLLFGGGANTTGNLDIDGCVFLDYPGSAIVALVQNGLAPNVLISKCQFAGAGNLIYGISLVYESAFQWLIDGCSFVNCLSAGIYHANANGIQAFSATKNSFTGCGGGMFVSQPLHDSIISENTFSGIPIGVIGPIGGFNMNFIAISSLNMYNVSLLNNIALSAVGPNFGIYPPGGGLQLLLTTGVIDNCVITGNNMHACTSTKWSVPSSYNPNGIGNPIAVLTPGTGTSTTISFNIIT